jgi:hypothetical protein
VNPWGKGKDHPHLRSPKGVMSPDEIRFWIKELLTKHGWGPCGLARAVGICDAGGLKSKLRKSWIFPGEQIRFSRQLDRIISGELIPKPIGPQGRIEAVLADNPKPLVSRPRMAYDLTAGRLGFVNPRITVPPTLPSFFAALSDARRWTNAK